MDTPLDQARHDTTGSPEPGVEPLLEAHPGQAHPERDLITAKLLRQIASGMSIYRLFPGDLGQTAFVQAVERIRTDAQLALAAGVIEVEILGSRIATPRGRLPTDDRLERLAMALYDHRAERMVIRSIPDAHDLASLFEALSRTSPDEATTGGVGTALRVAGVRSITVTEVELQAQDSGQGSDGPSPEQRATWDRMGDPTALARQMASELPRSTLAQAADTVVAGLRELVAGLPRSQVDGFELYRRLQIVVANLPSNLRRGVLAILLKEVREDPVAERFIGTMTDADLARLLVEQGAGGRADPMELGRGLIEDGIRRSDILDLTKALMMGQVEGGTILVGLEQVGITDALEYPTTVIGAPGGDPLAPAQTDSASPVVQTVSSLLARGLVSMGQDDVRSIREHFPRTDEDNRAMAFGALRDYLLAETDVDRFGDVLGVWVEECTRALRSSNAMHLDDLMLAIEGMLDGTAGVEKRVMAEASIRRVLSQEMLGELVALAGSEADAESTVRLLRPFGEAAVESLIDELAREKDRGRRALLLKVLAPVAQGYHHRVARRLSDTRWYVARNAATILHRMGGPEVVPVLIEALLHREPAVRREVIRGLVDLAGHDAMPQLLIAAGDVDQSVRATVITALGTVSLPWASQALAQLAIELREQPERRRALDVLSRHPAPEASGDLEGVISARGGARLPRRLRRYARGLLRERKEGRP